MTSSFPPCYGCIHLHPTKTLNDFDDDVPLGDRLGAMLAEQGHRCDAYPDGIPDAIIVRGHSHDEPRGDEVDGLYFDPDPDREAYNIWRAWFYDPNRPPVPTAEELRAARQVEPEAP